MTTGKVIVEWNWLNQESTTGGMPPNYIIYQVFNENCRSNR